MAKKMKTCKSCGKEIAKNAKTCPYCGRKNGLPTWAKLIILLVVIFVGFVACTNSCVNTWNKAVEETKNEYKDINGKTTFKLSESFQNKYEKVTLIDVDTNFKDYDEYFGPTEGYKYVMVKFETENVSENDDERYISELDFHGFADGVAVQQPLVVNNDYKSLIGTIGIGKKIVGYIFYEVPVTSKEIKIQYKSNFWVDGTAIEFIVSE
jgi:hypothetical protein